jgi:hypothetical protein
MVKYADLVLGTDWRKQDSAESHHQWFAAERVEYFSKVPERIIDDAFDDHIRRANSKAGCAEAAL